MHEPLHQRKSSSYYSNEGRRPASVLAALRSAPYMGSALDWAQLLEAWRAEGSPRGLKLTQR